MIRLTASGLPRAEQCAASGHLQHDPHPVVYADATSGVDKHAVRASAEARPGFASEVPLAWNALTGEGRVLEPLAAPRAYPTLPGEGWIYGTTDTLGREGDVDVIEDYKSGYGHMVSDARENLQLGLYALAASAERAVVRIVGDEGTRSEATLDALDLGAMAARIRRVYEGVVASQRNGPLTVEGAWCWRCPCAWRCPEKRTAATALASADPKLPTLELTPDAVAVGWERLRYLKALLGDIERAYRSYAASTPVPLANGKTLGEVEKQRDSIDGRIAYDTLRALHGEAVALAAVGLDASKASVERAVKPLAAKGAGAAAVRSALEAIRAAGGIATKTTRSVEEH